jgi:hypothetical protein
MRYIGSTNQNSKSSSPAFNANELYINPKHVRNMKAAQQNTRQVLMKFNFPLPPKTPPKLSPKLMNQSSHNTHIYDVLPPRRQNTPSQPSRNSFKKKANIAQQWKDAIATAQKTHSPKTRKSPPTRENVTKLAKLFETGKTKNE